MLRNLSLDSVIHKTESLQLLFGVVFIVIQIAISYGFYMLHKTHTVFLLHLIIIPCRSGISNVWVSWKVVR